MNGQRPPRREVHGILLLDKPQGLSSNQALQRAKRLFAAAKAGHTGALDPLATGMLPVCFGAATRFSHFLLEATKSYRVVCSLGVATDTGDAEGQVVERASRITLDRAAVEAKLRSFEGEIEQVPPMYSALKHRGQRLYRLARRGVDVERKPRKVTIQELRLCAYDWPLLDLTVTCSKGTYVRSLVVDIATALGTVGHVAALRRLSVGPYQEHQMHTLSELEELAAVRGGPPDDLLLPLDSALVQLPSLHLDEQTASRLRQGQRVAAQAEWPRGWVRLYGAPHTFLGVGEVLEDGDVAPRRILPQSDHGAGRGVRVQYARRRAGE